MKKRVFSATFAALCATILLLSACLIFTIYDSAVRRTQAQNAAEAEALAEALHGGADIAQYAAIARRGGLRVTLITAAGDVLYDNMADVASMEKHLDREEFREAREAGAGDARRDSETLGEQYFYHALRLADGSLLRVARSQRSIFGLLRDVRFTLAALILAAMALAAFLARRIAALIAEPLARLDLDRPEENEAYEELTPLLRRIAQQKAQLNEQLEAARLRSRQIEEITRNMREGLIVLGEAGNILSLNESAARLLNIGGADFVGKHLFELNRSVKLCELFEIVRSGRECETMIEFAERAVELHASPVLSDTGIYGYVFLIVDVTERRNAERMRREFSANVSHELKTPLTSISGYAEIMRDGLVRPEDVGAFAGKIYLEARRMITLVEDIMRLSKLDEGVVNLPFEAVRLRPLLEEVVASLSEKAADKGVRIELSEGDREISAVRQLVWEIFYNLIDNAIKYNVAGGLVTIRVDGLTVRVEDTGIGIAPMHQEKIFERFYRVDKSHSKATGGTGLGLSIVKHGAEYLGARLTLHSAEGEGTRVEVTFPESAR